MSDPRGKQCNLTLADGRQVTVGAAVDEDRGAWISQQFPLLRWMTPEDTNLIAVALSRAAEHLEANPPAPLRNRRRP